MREYYFRFQLLYYEHLVWISCFKATSFFGNKPALYSCNTAGIFIEPIFFSCSVFLNNHNDVIFTLTICTRYMTIDNKIMYLILGLPKILQQFKSHVLILNSFYLIMTTCDGLSMLFLYFLYTLFGKPFN